MVKSVGKRYLSPKKQSLIRYSRQKQREGTYNPRKCATKKNLTAEDYKDIDSRSNTKKKKKDNAKAGPSSSNVQLETAVSPPRLEPFAMPRQVLSLL
jgi:hypothetical protein